MTQNSVYPGSGLQDMRGVHPESNMYAANKVSDQPMKFTELRKINVNEHVEKKNGLSYLSWAWAVDKLLELDNGASWEYNSPVQWGESVMVSCTVTAFGKNRTAHLPVMDYRNKAILNPNAFDANTAMQRCLAKAIALHGIGLYIYAGEDIPPDAGEVLANAVATADARPLSGAGDGLTEKRKNELMGIAVKITEWHEEQNFQKMMGAVLDIKELEEKVFLWSSLNSKVRSTITKQRGTYVQA